MLRTLVDIVLLSFLQKATESSCKCGHVSKDAVTISYGTIETRRSMHLARLLRNRLKNKTDRTKRKALEKGIINHQYLNQRRFLPRAAKTIQKHKKQSSVKQPTVKVVDIRKNKTFLHYPRHSIIFPKTKSYLSEEDLIERQSKIYRANLMEINRKFLTANAFWKKLDLVK